MKTLGLLINPIAGMGGSVGLKGTDGVLEQALAKGAVPSAQKKVLRALRSLADLEEPPEIITCGGSMGQDALEALHLPHKVVYSPAGARTSSRDTAKGAIALAERGADLIAFAGGDGTARDICAAVGERRAALGIPAGVKIQSPVYAKTPEKAGELIRLYLSGQTTLLAETEVVDLDEEDYRHNVLSTRLYGYLRIPCERRYLQNRKTPSPLTEQEAQMAIAAEVSSQMRDDHLYFVGPGSTTRALMEYLGAANTLLGMDAVVGRQTVAADLDEAGLLDWLSRKKAAKLIVTPTGGQGYLFGRGNQQLSARVLRELGKKNIMALATKRKLAALEGRPLLVDTGDPLADEVLRGYLRVIVGRHESIIYPVE